MNPTNAAVVVPVFNRPKTVLKTLDSVAAQTARPSRLVVVDDGSSDETTASVRSWITRNSPSFSTMLVWQPNRGAAAARNRGLQVAQDCRYVAFLDSDDRWPSDFLSRTTSILQQRPQGIAVSTDRLQVNPSSGRSKFRSQAAMPRNPHVWLLQNPPGIGSATLFRTDAVRDVGGYNEQTPTGHDLELFLRIATRGRWLYAPGSPVVYQCGPGNGPPDEEGHLSSKYPDRHRIWARVVEEFILHRGGNELVPERVYAKKLAEHWVKAGRGLLKLGHVAEARECLEQSLRWHRWSVTAWHWWWRANLRSAG
jgi:glycosyltransferase involved in cell wall biosynthesis